ncbi:MAG TPA: DUF4124 domain-containing protein [Rhodanobacteraceae bacterium]|nr:DUF4124 domain-containing protein [Rhodanobacteraceae bacterium]
MQLRTFFVASVVGLSIACIAGFASAQQIYKWKDSSGVVHFSQTPPAHGAHYTKMHLTSEPEVSSTTPAPADNQSDANSEEKSATARRNGSKTTQPDTPSNRAELCKQLGSNIALLQSKNPVVTNGDNGEQQVMSGDAREQQLATARAQQVQYCGGGGGGGG